MIDILDYHLEGLHFECQLEIQYSYYHSILLLDLIY